jgi:MFS family permease
MFSAARLFCALFCSYGFLILANGLFMTLLSLRIKSEGYSTTVVGLLMTGYFLGMFLGARYSSRVVRRSGHIRSFAAFASMMSMSPLLHMLWIEPGFWLVLRLVDGFCLAGLYIVTESWLNARVDNNNRGGVLALLMAVNFLAYGLSQLLLQFADVGGFRLFAFCAVFFSLSVLPLLLTRSDAPKMEILDKLDLRYLLKVAPAGFWGATCSGAVYASFFGLAPVFSQELGQSTLEISYFMAAGVLGGVVLQIPLGKLSDRLERRRMIAAVSLGSSLCCAVLVWCAYAEVEFYVIVGSVCAFGSLVFVIYPLSVAHANDWCGQDKMMQTSSGLLLGYGCGAILGPMLSSALMDRFGPAALFIFIGTCCLLLMLYCLRQSWVGGHDREKISFVAHPCDHASVDALYQDEQVD